MFSTFILNPLYNGFVAILDILPNGDAGIGVILFTILTSLVLFPISQKALKTQTKLKLHEKELKDLRDRYKNNKEEQARAMLSFYKEKGINPFSSILLVFIQLPIVIGLYFVFARAGLPEIDPARLYSFVPTPETVNIVFLGLVDISQKSLILALFAAVFQFIQGWYSPAFQTPPGEKKRNAGDKPSFEETFQAGMRMQARYFLPGIIFLVSYQSGVLALYFATRSLFMFAQELLMRQKKTIQHNEFNGNQNNHQ